jgi:flagellar motor switch protein FliG
MALSKRDKKVAKDYIDLTGPEKAAILMLSLSEEQTTLIFSKLEPVEIRELSIAMVELGTVQADVVERTFVDFINQITSTGALVGSLESTERLLLKTLPPEQVDLIMEEIRGPAGRTLWDKLGNVNNEVLANYLKNEYPQTISLVLSRINPENAAKVLSMLPDQIALEVVMRLLKMETVRKEIIDDIEDTLKVEFMNNLARTSRRDQYEMVADIFNFFDKSAETRFLKALEERNNDSAERIRSLMFTFDDLMNIDTAGIQTLIRNVDKSKLAMSLKSAAPGVKSLFFSNMTERASKLLQEEIRMLGVVRLRDVEEAQNAIVSVAKELSASGQIKVKSKSEEEEVLVD